MIVEELVTKLGLEVDPEAFKILEEFQHAIHHGIAIAVGAAATAFAVLVHSTAEAALEVGKAASKLGETAESVSELKFAADRSEVSFESLAQGLKFLGKNAVEAAQGNRDLQQAFGGVKLHDAAGKIRPASELLKDLSDRFKALPDDAHRTNYAIRLFGRAGTELLPMLKKGSASFEQMAEEARRLGVVFTDEDTHAAREFDEGLKDVRDSLLGLRNAFALPFLEAFGELFKGIAGLFVRARPYVQKFGLAIRQVAAEFWAMLKPVREAVSHLLELANNTFIAKILKSADSFSLLKGVMLGFLTVAALVVTTMVGGAIETAAAWLAAAAPFILLAALIGLIVDDIYNFIEGNDSMIGRIQKWATVVNPDDHPLIKFLKNALQLLFDLGDPAKWKRVKDSATDAFKSLVTETDQEATQRVAYQKAHKGENGLVDFANTVNDSINGFLNRPLRESFGLQAAGGPGGIGSDLDPAVLEVLNRQNGGAQTTNGGHTITNNVTVNANGLTAEEAKAVAHEAINSTLSATLPAVSGTGR